MTFCSSTLWFFFISFAGFSCAAFSLHSGIPRDPSPVSPLSGDCQCLICIFSQKFLLSFREVDKNDLTASEKNKYPIISLYVESKE